MYSKLWKQRKFKLETKTMKKCGFERNQRSKVPKTALFQTKTKFDE